MKPQLSDGFVEVETREDVLIARFTQLVSLCGEVAEDTAEQLSSLLPEAGRQRLLVAFGNVQTLTRFMLDKLVRLNCTAAEAGLRLALFSRGDVSTDNRATNRALGPCHSCQESYSPVLDIFEFSIGFPR